MSELRFNELRGEEVVYAAHRQDRTLRPGPADCPLCPGSEEIPVEAFEIAVLENRFPAFDWSEVVVYTDSHEGSFGGLPGRRAEALMWVWRDRYRELGARPDVDYVLIFENRGAVVGATLDHPHGQIHGYPFLPPVPAAERAADERHGGCVVCSVSRRELEGERVVWHDGGVAAYVPYAARWPYEIHVTPLGHRASLLDCDAGDLRGLAAGLQAVARGYDALWDRPLPYMMVVHQAPTDGIGGGHVHVEFYTPLRAPDTPKYLASGEQGAGTFTVDVLPERAAAELRAAIERAG